MASIGFLLKDLEKHLEHARKEADEACVCKYCGSKRKPTEYKANNKYYCHNCSAEWPTLFKNYFWKEYCGELYDECRRSLLVKRAS